MRSVLFGVCCFLTAAILVAQSDRGTVTGTVSDPAGAVVAGAPIQARNIETGATYQTASSATGNFSIAQLPVGTYEVTVTVQGFKKYIRAGLQVGVAQTLRVDIPLEVGATSEAVTVTEAAPLLKTESGELSHTVNVGQLKELPLFVVTAGLRNPYRIMDMIPGTVSASDIRVNGAPSNSANYRIEGQDASNAQLPSFPTQNQPSVDAIQEVAVQTSNFAAEYGQVGGGVLNITMRSGTNQFHGSVYEYLVNEALNAGQPYTDNGNGKLIRPRTRRNDYGYTVGGPVWVPKIYDGRDKTFFFISWEQYKVTLSNDNDPKTVPTAAYRTGDFRAAILPNARVIGTDPLGNRMLQGMIYDPGSTRLVNGLSVRDQFPNNSIPAASFDRVSAKLQSMFPAPIGANSGALINNFINPYPSSDKRSVPSIKIDQAIRSKAKISFFWQRSRQDTIGGTGLQQGDGLPGHLTTALASFVKSPLYRLNFDYTLTPTMLLHLGGGYRKTSFGTPSLTADGKTVSTDAPYDAEKELGLKGGLLHLLLPRIAGVSDPLLGGMKDFGETTPAVYPVTQTPTFVAYLTWVKDNHTFKFGSEFKTEGSIAPSIGNEGSYTFAADQTGQPFQQTPVGGANVGLSYASFLLGQVKTVSMTGPTDPRLGKKQLGLYAQDTWKVTRKLTVDYGIRYDYSTYLQENYGRAPSFSPTAIHPKAGIPGAAVYDRNGPLQCNCNISHNYPFAFGPRLGIAYQIVSKTVLRAGFGIVYNGTEQNNGAAGTVANAAGSGTVGTFGNALTTLSAGYPSQFYPRAWPSYDAAFFPTSFPVPGAGPTNYDRNAGRPARQYQWSIGVQREITRDLVVEASYVANRGIWWQAPGLLNFNAASYERLKARGIDPINNQADRALLTSSLSSAAATARGLTAPYAGFPLSQTVFQSLRPFPQFTTIPVAYAPLGKTWYDSLQVKVDKRFSHGLTFSTAFSWQKNMIMGADREPNFGTDASGQANDVFNRPNAKYISSTSQPLVLVTSFSYITPKAPGNRIVGAVTRDWTLGMFVAYRSGQPYLAPSSQGLPGNSALQNYLGQSTFANRVPGEPLFTVDLDCHCYDPRNVFVLNPKAWAEPAPGTFGTAAAYYTDYRQQRRPQENLNFGRTFRFTERISFSIRGEFSNIFNRAMIASVGTGPTTVGGTPTINNLTNATTSVQNRNPNGTTASGFGALLNLAPVPPRQGNIVARITF
ncbi:MAG TPA: TonB-dependent receptor [Bryobacteraceae bacterium]|nr:TonB-dependent receptor [Bryobacteraceae bacterium]